MEKRSGGYGALAAAVIKRTVLDVKGGSRGQRELAVHDIEAGGLEPWIDMMCVAYDMGEGLRYGLAKIVRDYPA
jgi:hypothetical protein